MDPAEVMLLNFIGVALLYCISFFIIFSFIYSVMPSHYLQPSTGRHINALQKISGSFYMVILPSFLQLTIISPSQKTGKGGGCDA